MTSPKVFCLKFLKNYDQVFTRKKCTVEKFLTQNFVVEGFLIIFVHPQMSKMKMGISVAR